MATTWVQQNDTASAVTDGTGALTLAEAARIEKDTLKKGVLELFANDNPVLERCPFMDIEGNSLMYNYETKLPGVGFRSVNEGYSTSHAQTAQRTVGLAIAGGDLDVDKFIIQTRGSVNNQRAIQEAAQVKAMSLKWLKTFFDGDRSGATPANEEFDGLNILLADSYYTDKGMVFTHHDAELAAWDISESGSPLQDDLDEAIDKVIGTPDFIFCNKQVKRFLTRVARKNSQITVDLDRWGYSVTKYADIPLIAIEDDNLGSAILGQDEHSAISETSSSLYVGRFGADEYVSGLQNGGMQVTDIGELETKPAMRTRVEWYTSLAIFHPRSVARITGISNTFSQA
jgi:hypothetical protein